MPRRAFAGLILAVAVLLSACTLQPDVSQAAPNGRVGTAAPPLSGQALAGDHLSVDFRQSKTVLVFWAAWCGPCRQEQPGLNALAAKYAGQGIRFVGVDLLDHDRALARAFVAEFKVTYPSLYDDAGSLAAAYRVDSPPSFVFIDQRGVVVNRYPGETSEAHLENLVQKLVTVH
ncbi:MAG TPA: TlpA disulfide reductase family protein [Candidatus Acidoferrum sp.]|jgi:thiol-disulfide isomerase/thioredoxin|nr:TlpA disulfide reductase family protein [Candidatus Acidoferrum sp.]